MSNQTTNRHKRDQKIALAMAILGTANQQKTTLTAAALQHGTNKTLIKQVSEQFINKKNNSVDEGLKQEFRALYKPYERAKRNDFGKSRSKGTSTPVAKTTSTQAPAAKKALNTIHATRTKEALEILNNAIQNGTNLTIEAKKLGKDFRFVNTVNRFIIKNPNTTLSQKVRDEFNAKYAKFSRPDFKKKTRKRSNNQVPALNTNTPAPSTGALKIVFHENLPIPNNPRGRKGKESKYQFEKIKKGHAAVYEINSIKEELRIRQAAVQFAKRKKISMVTAKVDKNRIGVWHISKAEAKLRAASRS